MKLLLTSAFSLFLPFLVIGQSQIVSGPMLGHFDYHAGTIWMQLSDEGTVQVNYWDVNDSADTLRSIEVTTHLAHANTAHVHCANLKPGTVYGYEVIVDGIRQMEGLQFKTQEHWQYRTDPPKFKVAIGSCTYISDASTDRPGEPYGGEYGIFEQVADQNPDAMIWLGDNVYFRETDVTSKEGMQYRYTHTRGLPEMQELLRSCNHYAIWDDHDYGPDNSTKSFYLKHTALECFQDFWANPGYGLSDNAGITSQFAYNDVEFFLLDNRWYRTDPKIEGFTPTILGEEQITWLIEALKFSKARFKMVCIGGQFLSDFPKYENYARFPNERQRILSLISDNNIKGVVFLTGDRHSTELSKYKMESKDWIYDLTASPLTSSSYDHSKELNHLRVDGTHVGDRNFAILEFSGPFKDREMKITVYNTEGKEQWSQTITEDEQ